LVEPEQLLDAIELWLVDLVCCEVEIDPVEVALEVAPEVTLEVV